jgi:hypothetical protein
MSHIFSLRYNGLLAFLCLPLGVACLVIAVIFPLVCRRSIGHFVGWATFDEDHVDHYYAARYRYADSKGVDHEFISGEGVFSREPPDWTDSAPPPIRYFPLWPHFADVAHLNPFFAQGMLYVLMGAPIWSIIGAICLVRLATSFAFDAVMMLPPAPAPDHDLLLGVAALFAMN